MDASVAERKQEKGGGGWQQAVVSPRLEVIACASFSKVWDDRGTGSRGDVSIWRVVPPPGYYCLGDYAEGHHTDQPSAAAVVVREAVEGDTKLLAKPVDYVKTWDDRKTGAKYGHVSFWRPVPPPGYVALGDVTTNLQSDQKPSTDLIRCVHLSMVTIGQWAYPQLWWDSGSGGQFGDSSLWRPVPKDNQGANTPTFKSDWSHCFPVSFPAYVLKDQARLHSASSKHQADPNSSPLGRKVTLMSHAGRFLRLRDSGEAFTATWAGTQDDTSGEPEETWTMVQTPQQKASFKNRHGLYLSCKPSGELEGVGRVTGEREEFEVMMIANDKISIKSHLGKYLTVPRNADSDLVAAQSDKSYSWTLSFLSVTSGVYATFRSHRGQLMSAASDGTVVLVDRDEPGPPERWTLYEDERKLTLLSHWGYYLSAAGGSLSVRSRTVTEAERFWRFTHGENRLIIRSKVIDRNVTAAATGDHVDVSEKKTTEPAIWTVQLTFY